MSSGGESGRASTTVVEVFFDGECPLCAREIAMVRTLDRAHRIRFTDIAAPSFDAVAIGTTYEALMERIRARLPDGTWIEGVEVFRRMYGAIGLGPLVPLTRLPGISHALELGYERFAKNRLRWTGRCVDGQCAVPPREARA
jgi:predicted DCC family thiol-disulfide oxidoreductase YuxK